MCDRKDGAIDVYEEAKDILHKDHIQGKLSDEIYSSLSGELSIVKENMDSSDYRSFKKDVYDILKKV